MWGEEGFAIICREFSLSLSCRWLEEDVATSEPGQKEQETNLKPSSSVSCGVRQYQPFSYWGH